jgi:hypothetical protein
MDSIGLGEVEAGQEGDCVGLDEAVRVARLRIDVNTQDVESGRHVTGRRAALAAADIQDAGLHAVTQAGMLVRAIACYRPFIG